jgi:CheY-like chemotaxis protein
MEKIKRALVVDDSLSSRAFACKHIESFGFKVDCANNVTEALDIIEAKPDYYDIIFLGHALPSINGIDMARQIRQMDSKHTRRVPIIAWANAFTESRDVFLNNGFTGFLKKPIERKELRKVLEAV